MQVDAGRCRLMQARLELNTTMAGPFFLFGWFGNAGAPCITITVCTHNHHYSMCIPRHAALALCVFRPVLCGPPARPSCAIATGSLPPSHIPAHPSPPTISFPPPSPRLLVSSSPSFHPVRFLPSHLVPHPSSSIDPSPLSHFFLSQSRALPIVRTRFFPNFFSLGRLRFSLRQLARSPARSQHFATSASASSSQPLATLTHSVHTDSRTYCQPSTPAA